MACWGFTFKLSIHIEFFLQKKRLYIKEENEIKSLLCFQKKVKTQPFFNVEIMFIFKESHLFSPQDWIENTAVDLDSIIIFLL